MGWLSTCKADRGNEDELNLVPQEVSERLGLSTQEVNRRYRAFKALQQFQDDEEHGSYGTPEMYPVFHEAVSLPIVRQWLGCDETEHRFTDEDARYEFFNLITPSFDDDGNESRPKISGYSQVRELRHILAKPEARRALLDPHRSFQDAVNVARREEMARLWVGDVSAAVESLKGIGIDQLKRLTEDDIDLLNRLLNLVNERLEDHRALRGDEG